MAHLLLPTLGLTAVSMALSLATIGAAGHTLNVYSTQQSTNPWFLPLWADHFDTRSLRTLIGCAAVLIVLDAVVAGTQVVARKRGLVMTLKGSGALAVASSVVAVAVALVAVVYPAVLNSSAAPERETLQTWTCRWSGMAGAEAPAEFGALCRSSGFAFWATIPLFLLQILLVGISVMVLGQQIRARHHGNHHNHSSSFFGGMEAGSERLATPQSYETKLGFQSDDGRPVPQNYRA